MNCPVDGTLLTIADRSGIEIDWCPTCRGVWLDRGELDKIIDRTAADIGGKCLEMRVYGYNVPAGGRTVYMTDFFHGSAPNP